MYLLLALTALAQDADQANKVATTINNDFEIRYYVDDERLPDPDDVPVFNYVEQVNRLNASASSGALSLEIQVDEVALFANQYKLDDEFQTERELLGDQFWAPLASDKPNSSNTFGYITLEKIRGRVEKDSYSLSFGDVYAAFGRGIALNMNRNVDIDIDTSIQGFKGVFRPGAWDVTAVAGQMNRQQVFQDNPNIQITGDKRHAMAGLRAERFGLGPANIGAHTVAYDFVEGSGFLDAPLPGRDLPGGARPPAPSRGLEELGSTPDAVIGGATLELFGVGGIDWFAEGDVFGFPTTVLTGTEGKNPQRPGYATYASGAFYPGKTTWLVEFKRYLRAERVNSLLGTEFYEVAVAPTLEYERAINEDTSAALNSDDIWGGRVRMDYTAKPGELIPYVQLGLFRDQQIGDALHFNTTPETIAHAVTGVEYIREHGAALINVGYRRDQRDLDPNGAPNCDNPANGFRCEPGADQLIHGDSSIKFPFVAGLHAEVQTDVQVWSWGVNEFQQGDFVVVTNGLTVQKGSDVAVTLFTDFSTNPLVDSTGNLPFEIDTEQPAAFAGGDPTTLTMEPLYGAVEVQVKPTDALTLKAFYGAYKAGIRCAGGQCRQLPGFEGGRLGMTGSF